MSILDELSKQFPQSSKNTLRSWIKEGRVFLNGTVVKNSSVTVVEGDEVSLGQRKKMIRPGIRVLYEDNDLVIIDKPNGLLSVDAAFEKEETVLAYLKEHYHSRKVCAVHRLDQDTSGVMVFALNMQMAEKLKSLFEMHAIERVYVAIVEGRFTTPSGTWQSYQYEDSQYFVHETPDPEKGRIAITHYKMLTASKYYSLLELHLETGRKNQIRVHCKSAGHPVAGDKKYGGTSNPIKRLCLHARLLGFEHPYTKQKLQFESPVPADFYRLVKSS